MPTISMFYGILVSIFFEDSERHHLPHIHVRYSGEKAALRMVEFLLATFHKNNSKWFKHGLRFIKTNCLLIGNWRHQGRNRSVLRHYSRG